MLRFEFTLPYDDMNLFLYGDDHEGSLNRHINGFEMMVDMLHSPWDGLSPAHNKAIDHGDFMEAIHITDPRYQFDTTVVYDQIINDGERFNENGIMTKRQVKKNNITLQVDAAYEHRRKIAEKLLVIMDGNHPHKLHKYGDLTQDLCDRLRVNFGSWTAHITYKVKPRFGLGQDKFLFNHFATHGWRSVNSAVEPPERAKVNMQIQLKNLLKDHAGDTLLMSMGHTHKLLVKPPISLLYIEGQGDKVVQKYTSAKKYDGYIHPDYRWFVNTGSFLKTYGTVSGYAERFGYKPNELGFAVVEIRNGKIAGVKRCVVGSTGILIFND
jgi:hypothetical protein